MKRQAPLEQRLRLSDTILNQLSAEPRNGISDAILNRTACFAMFPDSGSANAVSGFAACRNRRGAWASPAVAILSQPSQRRVSGALLILILSERARRALIQNKIEFDEKLVAARGPLESEESTMDPGQLNQDALAYVARQGSFAGVKLEEGQIQVDSAATTRLYGHGLDVHRLLDDSTMSSTATSFFKLSVDSFFNTITPIGIIVHHSVLIPAKDLPDAERELDRFHYSRGFEISCFGKIYHIAYHFLILPNGQIRPGRPERCEGAHARGYNSYLGIALVGDFSSSNNPRGRKGPKMPTRAQRIALIRLCRQLREKYNIPLQRILPHSGVSRTECPGDRLEFPTILAAIEQPAVSGL